MAGMVTPIVQSIPPRSAAAAPSAKSDDLATIETAVASTAASSRSTVSLRAAGLIGSVALTQQGSSVEADSAAADASLGIRTYYEAMAERFDPADEPVIFGLRDDVATIGSFWI